MRSMLLLALALVLAAPAVSKVDDGVWTSLQNGTGEFLVVLSEQADLGGASFLPDRQDKGRHVFTALTTTADRTQTPLVALLESAGAEYRRFWIANLIWVRGDVQLLQRLADRDDVARILANPRIRVASDEVAPAPATTRTVEWNLTLVGGPPVWATGNTGQNGVIGVLDSGVDWDHPALRNQYRGWNGATADHDYNWHDATAAHAPAPDDPSGHGTRAIGVAVGDDGEGTRIGLAPGARWIAARCLDQSWGTPATFIECLEWMVAPYPVGGTPADGDPAQAPDVVLTCWSCLPAEGCAWDTLLPVIANVRAAGICVVAIAGGYGPQCGTVQYPPEIYDDSFTVGTTDGDDLIASFSSRGPVTTDGSNRIKPDICAPGVNVRSSTTGGGYVTTSGASVAAPHAAGLVALLVTANPLLKGHVDAIETLITDSAVPRAASQCGDGTAVPNNVYGHGRIDAAAACADAVTGVDTPPATLSLTCAPNPFNPRTTLAFDLDAPAFIRLRIYDVAGRIVRTLAAGANLAAGRHEVTWNGADDRGRDAGAGVYFARLENGSRVATQRLTLVR